MEAFIKTNETYLVSDLCVKASCSDGISYIPTAADEKRFICDICEDEFSDKSHLKKHFRCHTKKKLHSCNICSKEIFEKNMTLHFRTHTNEKPYSCDVCHKEFSHESHLNSHYRTHTNEKPYSCDVCHKMFSHKSVLNAHYRTHTNEKPYSCDVCDKEFSFKRYLNVLIELIQMKSHILVTCAVKYFLTNVL
ncbi:Zinc finger protein 782 [Araneus ventricosus]|uniref:Zinc finger protein 782 n=1 Tax=Araneus ventricosus TaxID=182803 RepID=A0A4Y2HQC2_ARAVE|nr:Zinc finger protein 782 [Araneus ventricosus]